MPPTDEKSASFKVRLPAEAKVYVNDMLTKTEGTDRQYVSRNLNPGQAYTFKVRAELERDGKVLTKTQTLTLQAGSESNIAFDFDSTATDTQVAESAVKTKLTLHVPAVAKVVLAGRETRSAGPVREFTTTKLAAGESWSNYKILVTVNQNGRELSQEKTIELNAGEDREMRFNFGADRVASAK